MMGTEKLDKRFVGTALVSVLISLLLALTPVLAVAEPVDRGGSPADAVEETPSDSEDPEAAGDVSADAADDGAVQPEAEDIAADATVTVREE